MKIVKRVAKDRQSARRQYNEKRKRRRQHEAKKRKAANALSMLDRPYLCEDADAYGKYMKSKIQFKLVECRTSEIDGAGIGVFACVDLEVGDIVSFFTGKFVKDKPKERKEVEYTITVTGGYLVGIQKPQVGKGVASFVNRESRILKKWKNCNFIPVGKKSVYLEITRRVPLGRELFTCYGFGYRIN